MSFGFQFADSELDDEYVSLASAPAPTATPSTSNGDSSSVPQAPYQSYSLDDMLDHLPSRISYSSISIPLASRGTSVQMLRRDLFDARFQMLLDEDDDDKTSNAAGMDAQVDAQSDLIPGVYEGGLKTWECALDLVETLDGLHSGRWSEHFSGKYILELGCGTALPSLFMLTQVLNDRAGVGMTLNLADYNAQVLQLVTLPNVLLAWWSSAAAAAFRAGAGAQQTALERHELARRGQDHFDTAPHDVDGHGELAITPELVSAFRTSLAAHGVQVNFIAGAWTNFPPPARGMDLILTSETVYALPSLSPLVRLLHTYAAADAAVLVAAKVIYFGVGGGVEAFKQTLAQLAPSAQVASIHTVTRGVGRTVLSVTF